MTTKYWLEELCAVCGKAFESIEDWDARHDLHDSRCKVGACYCDYPAHRTCCPCQTGKQPPDGLRKFLGGINQ